MRTSALAAVVLFLCGWSGVSAAEQEGWVELFDGKTLNGWIQKNGTATYRVENGTVVGKTNEGSPNSFLCTEKDYADFELEFEVKVDDRLNSGVQLRSKTRDPDATDTEQKKSKRKKSKKNDAEKKESEKKEPEKRDPEKNDAEKKDSEKFGRVYGPQVEIEASGANGAEAGYVYGEGTQLGWLTPEDRLKPHKHFKDGEWNKYRVVAKGPRIQTWINGQPIEDLTHEEIYKTHPSGFISLQVHGIPAGSGPYEVAWRNIRIRELGK